MGKVHATLDDRLKTWRRTTSNGKGYWSHDADGARIYYPERFGWGMIDSTGRSIEVDKHIAELKDYQEEEDGPRVKKAYLRHIAQATDYLAGIVRKIIRQ